MVANLPVLQVVIPLIAAALCAPIRSGRIVWGIAVLITWVTLGVSIAILGDVLASGPITYEIGGWAAPWGIEYRVDVVNAYVLVLVAGLAAVVAPFARLSVEKEISEENVPRFYVAFLLCVTGLLGMAVTGDLFNVFVFLEISSLSSYTLVAMGSDRRALTSAFRYLVMGSIGATFIVIGIGFLYSVTGTLNMADLALRLPDVSGTRTVPVAFGFLVVGIGLKLAIFPLHLWLPGAYAYAPSVGTALLASTATKVAVYLLLRVLFTIFGAEFSFGVMQLDLAVIPLALIAIVSMSLVAIFQDDVKRMLAYSSLAQIGYIMLGVSLVSVDGLTAATIHLFNHALMKGALFLALGCVAYRIGSTHFRAIAGLGREMPLTMAAFVLGGLSLIGVPLTVGFISKWYLLVAVLERGWWLVALLIVISSLLAVVYIWRVVESAYFQPRPPGREVTEAPMALLIPVWVLVAANFYFGIDATLTAGVARRAAETLLSGGQ